jgi:hypothetical protein
MDLEQGDEKVQDTQLPELVFHHVVTCHHDMQHPATQQQEQVRWGITS